MNKNFFAAEIMKLLECYADEHCDNCNKDKDDKERLNIIKSYPEETDLFYILEMISESPCFEYVHNVGLFLEELYSEEKKIELYENLSTLYQEIETLKEVVKEEECTRTSKRLDRM